jgi:hypothetical protein
MHSPQPGGRRNLVVIDKRHPVHIQLQCNVKGAVPGDRNSETRLVSVMNLPVSRGSSSGSQHQALASGKLVILNDHYYWLDAIRHIHRQE